MTVTKHPSYEEASKLIKTRLPIALVGPTGSGKTYAARQLCIDELSIKPENYFTRAVNRQTASHDFIGFMNAQGSYVKGAFSDAIRSNEPSAIVFDEFDNGNENTSLILKGLFSGRLYMPYGMQEVNPSLYVVVTMNTWGNGASREYVGRNTLDAALLNEFQFCVWGYDTGFERELFVTEYNKFKTDTITRNENEEGEFFDWLQQLRKNIETHKTRAILGTRNLLQCARLLACTDFTWTEIVCKNSLASVSSSDRDKLFPVIAKKIRFIRHAVFKESCTHWIITTKYDFGQYPLNLHLFEGSYMIGNYTFKHGQESERLKYILTNRSEFIFELDEIVKAFKDQLPKKEEKKEVVPFKPQTDNDKQVPNVAVIRSFKISEDKTTLEIKFEYGQGAFTSARSSLLSTSKLEILKDIVNYLSSISIVCPELAGFIDTKIKLKNDTLKPKTSNPAKEALKAEAGF